MTIGKRIALGFLTVLLLTMVVAFVGWSSLRTYAGRVDVAAHTADLDTRLKAVRIEEARFVTERDAGAAASVPGMLETLRAEARETKGALDDAGGVRLLDDILAGIDGYRAAFANFVAQDKEAHARTEGMETRARALKDIAEKIGRQQSDRYDQNMVSLRDAEHAVRQARDTSDRADRLIETVLEARRLQADFLRTRNPSAMQAASEAVGLLLSNAETVEKDLAGTNDEDLAQRIVVAVRDYRAALDQASAAESGRGLDAHAQQIQKLAHEMQENQSSVSTALQEAAGYAQSEVNEAVQLRGVAMRLIQNAQAAMLGQRDYLLGGDAAARATVATAVKETLDLARQAGAVLVDAEGRALIAAITDAARAFDSEFAALSTAVAKQREASAAMAQASAAVSGQVGRLVTLQREDREAGRASAGMVIAIGAAVALLLGALMALYAIIQACLGQTVSGWASLMVSVWVIGGVQLIALGFIVTYVC